MKGLKGRFSKDKLVGKVKGSVNQHGWMGKGLKFGRGRKEVNRKAQAMSGHGTLSLHEPNSFNKKAVRKGKTWKKAEA